MERGELDVRHGVTLAPRGGGARGKADHYFSPRTAEEAALAVTAARDLMPDGAHAALTMGGAERSFEAHFLPRETAVPSVVLSSRQLRGDVRVLGETTTAGGERALHVRALAGTSFGELVSAVRGAGFDAVPFSCPTAAAISLGGALAVNTHARVSATYGGMFAEHVRRFTLLGADGKRYDCHAAAESELERRLFLYTPGALGSLGFVTEVELELAYVAPEVHVVETVLDSRRADPAATVAAYLEYVAADARTPRYPEGIGLVFIGAPGQGTGFMVGRHREARAPELPRLPLCSDKAELNLFVQAFAHRFPKVARGIATRLFPTGRSYAAPYDRWLFFQSSYDDGVARLERRAETPLFGFEPTLGLVHQAWVLTSGALPAFVALASELFATRPFDPVARALEWFDVLPLPPPVAPLDPSRMALRERQGTVNGDTHVLTLSVAVRDETTRELASAFCRTLIERAVAAELAVVVQLNKQHHVQPNMLRAMHRPALAELAALKNEVDPSGLVGSRSLERLGLGLALGRSPFTSAPEL